MPFALGGLVLALQVLCLIHAVKTGAERTWITILIILPGAGGLAYLLVELLPALLRSPQGQQAKRQMQRKLDPERDYRRLKDQADDMPSVQHLLHLAEECSSLGRHREAADLLERCLTGHYADDPRLLLHYASALLEAGEPAKAIAALDRLRAAHPDIKSAEGHLLYARAQAADGQLDEALAEYRALMDHYPGPEPACRYAELLALLGRTSEAEAVWKELKRRYDRAPKHVRRLHATWWDQVLARAGT